jgi:hypothetical protein
VTEVWESPTLPKLSRVAVVKVLHARFVQCATFRLPFVKSRYEISSSPSAPTVIDG